MIINSNIMFDIDEPNFIKWQRKCVCDFDNNHNTHSKSCKARFEEISIIKQMDEGLDAFDRRDK